MYYIVRQAVRGLNVRQSRLSLMLFLKLSSLQCPGREAQLSVFEIG